MAHGKTTLVLGLMTTFSLLFSSNVHALDLAQLERTIAKEPIYTSKTPRYARVVFGPDAKFRVWLVQDDQVLYVDRNGNGDLTEAGERIEPTRAEQDLYEYMVGDLTDGTLRHTDLRVWRQRAWPEWYDAKELARVKQVDGDTWCWNMEVSAERPADDQRPLPRHLQYRLGSGWSLVFSGTKQDAPILHCHGPWSLRLYDDEQHYPIGKPATVRVVVGTRGVGAGAFATLQSIAKITGDRQPVAEITYPDPLPAARLDFRVGGGSEWNASLNVPASVTTTNVKVRLSFDAWPEARIAPATVDMRLYDPKVTPSSQLLATVPTNMDVGRMVLSADGKILVISSYREGKISVLDVGTRRVIRSFQAPVSSTFSIALSKVGTTLAVGDNQYGPNGEADGGGVLLIDWATGKIIRRLESQPAQPVVSLALSPDGRTLATVEHELKTVTPPKPGRIVLWDMGTGKTRATLPESTGADLVFSPDGSTLATGTLDIVGSRRANARIRRWNVATARELPALPHPVNGKFLMHRLFYTPDGKTLAAADIRDNVVLWDTGTLAVRATLTYPKHRRNLALAISPDGRTVAVGRGFRLDHYNGDPGEIVLWDTVSQKPLDVLTGHHGEVSQVVFTPDGKTLISAGSEDTLCFWNVAR